MKRVFLTIGLSAVTLFMTAQRILPTNGIVYVNNNVNASGNGSSWGNAVKELADVLEFARENPSNHGITQVYVASGTYNPLYLADDNSNNNYTRWTNGGQYNSFVLVPNVRIFGGFPAPSVSNPNPTWSDRDWENNVTTLSGNYYNHVVISAGNVGNACLDGFTILHQAA